MLPIVFSDHSYCLGVCLGGGVGEFVCERWQHGVAELRGLCPLVLGGRGVRLELLHQGQHLLEVSAHNQHNSWSVDCHNVMRPSPPLLTLLPPVLPVLGERAGQLETGRLPCRSSPQS